MSVVYEKKEVEKIFIINLLICVSVFLPSQKHFQRPMMGGEVFKRQFLWLVIFSYIVSPVWNPRPPVTWFQDEISLNHWTPDLLLFFCKCLASKQALTTHSHICHDLDLLITSTRLYDLLNVFWKESFLHTAPVFISSIIYFPICIFHWFLWLLITAPLVILDSLSLACEVISVPVTMILPNLPSCHFHSKSCLWGLHLGRALC